MAPVPAADAFAGKWWVLLVRGVLAVLFGAVAIAMPGLTLVTLVLLYGVYALADGLTALWVGGSARAWPLVLIGILGVIVGVYAFVYPGTTAVVLLYIIAGWGVIRGVNDLLTAYLLRKDLKNVSAPSPYSSARGYSLTPRGARWRWCGSSAATQSSSAW